ncbi:MAG TPA: hypothetical protein PLG94_16750 [Smithellaceae bacterium]|nr:hypothetical protein [Smithellaceae bacterium]HPL68185.1 hypothetical protein [Smithellaceae bacterium]
MIYEYALDPEMVATWGSQHNYRFFIRAFGIGQGRVASRFPKYWAKKVFDSFNDQNDNEKKRLVEILAHLKENMVKRKDCIREDIDKSWLENALLEHNRYPFQAILAKNNPENHTQIICEEDVGSSSCNGWNISSGVIVKRNAADMAAAVEKMLSLCRWVKFIDPYIARGRDSFKESLNSFLKILANDRPVGTPEFVEIHTGNAAGDATTEYLRDRYFTSIIPSGMSITLFRWQEKPGGHRLHNRYILADIGGVAFLHGLDTGNDGETDDLNRLDYSQYHQHCREYCKESKTFELTEEPLLISGKRA